MKTTTKTATDPGDLELAAIAFNAVHERRDARLLEFARHNLMTEAGRFIRGSLVEAAGKDPEALAMVEALFERLQVPG